MKRYFGIDFIAMREFGLTTTEWFVCETIEFLCNDKPDSFYSNKTRAELGEYFGLSEDRMKRIILSLIKRGFLKANKKRNLRPGKSWSKIKELNGKELPKKESESVAHRELERELAKEPTREVEYGVYFEDEFGEDEPSAVEDAPTKNQVRKEATVITELRDEVSSEMSITMADSFWYKQEGLGWERVKRWEPLLKRFIDSWIRNDIENKKIKFKPKEPKITKPTSPEEMRLYLKQMSDDDRAKIKFNLKNKNNQDELVPMRINQNGFPVTVEGGDYQSDEYNYIVWNSFLERFKQGKNLW